MCECFHDSAVEAVSQSHVEEWISGLFIQSHWPCMTLWPISMFSRILASERPVTPSSHMTFERAAKSSTRDSTSSRRWSSIIAWM